MKHLILQLSPRSLARLSIDHRETGCEDVNWVKLCQNRVHWRALVNTIMKLCVP
jgi:hypothetical protein